MVVCGHRVQAHPVQFMAAPETVQVFDIPNTHFRIPQLEVLVKARIARRVELTILAKWAVQAECATVR